MITETRLRNNLLNKLNEIATILIDASDKFVKTTGLAGNAGLALFMYYFARFTGEDKYAEYGKDVLYTAIDLINRGSREHSFCNGIAGLAWACDHLYQQGFIEQDDILFLDDLDSWLLSKMEKDFGEGYYDFLHGGLGVGYYYITSSKSSDQGISMVLNELERLVEEAPDNALKWKSVIERKSVTYGYNIGLSHGMSSIAACLSKLIVLHPEYTSRAEPLLSGTVRYIIQQRLPFPDRSCFPTYSIESEGNSVSSRLGWCYGDLGIASVLINAAEALHCEEWKDIAINVLRHNCNRTDLRKNSVMDAGLCHGAAGIAHLFHRLNYRNINDDCFTAASEYWFQKALDLAYFEDGLAGYKTFCTPELGGWKNEYDFLGGIAGIGLTFISALSPVELPWDESILLS